jgi:hypothetical protein
MRAHTHIRPCDTKKNLKHTPSPPPHARLQIRRQVSSLRITAPPGSRSLVEEAAAAASCRALTKYVAADAQLKAAFVDEDGLSAVRELLDNPSERVRVCTCAFVYVCVCVLGGGCVCVCVCVCVFVRV